MTIPSWVRIFLAQVLMALALLVGVGPVEALAGRYGSDKRGSNNLGEGLAGSAHDFSEAEWNPSGKMCAPCHTSRRKPKQDKSSPAYWNHALSNAVYSTYTTVSGATASQPTGGSKLCLGCHDGTVALDDYGSGKHQNAFIPKDGLIGSGLGDLMRTHPISVAYDYDPAHIDGLRNPVNPMGISGSIASILDEGKVSCSSCHDVHNQVAVAQPLLRAPMRGSSELCLTCHQK